MAVIVSEMIYCLLHELQVPLNTLRDSYEILSKESPMAFPEEMQIIGEVCERFWAEVWNLRDHLAENVDLDSSTNAAAQVRQLASGWRTYEVTLSDAVDQVLDSRVELTPPSLNDIVNISLPGGLRGLKRMLSFLESLQPEQLTTRKTLSEIWEEKPG